MCYTPGTGKTAIVAEYCVHHFHGKVVYMGPKSLHPVFMHHVTRTGGNPEEEFRKAEPQTTCSALPPDSAFEGEEEKKRSGTSSTSDDQTKILRYGLVTSEASNVYEQMLRELEPVLGKITGRETASLRPDSANGEPVGDYVQAVIIMDECHLFSGRVARILSMLHYGNEQAQLEAAEKQAYKLYRFLCRDPRIRILAMTGTPIETHPFNLVPIVNIVRREFTGIDGRRSTAFPEVFGRFHESFVRGILSKIDERGQVARAKTSLTAPPILYEEKKMNTFTIRLRTLILWY
jgi:hypothetical protein